MCFQTGPITITGVTVKKARFTLDLPSHTLSFKSKVSQSSTFVKPFLILKGTIVLIIEYYLRHLTKLLVTE